MKPLLNISGFNYAEALVRAGKINFGDRLPTMSEWDHNSFISSKGYGAYSQWFLGMDSDIAENNTRGKWLYCFTTDFYEVSRALVAQTLDLATAAEQADIVEKATALLEAIDAKQMSVQFGAVSIASPVAADKKGWKWDVTIIREGETITNPPMYIPNAALHASVDVFEGAKVYANSVADKAGHKSNRNEKVPGDVIAVLSKPYVLGEELRATMTILPSGAWLKDNLLALNEENMIDTVYQLSVDSSVDAKRSFVASLNKTLPVVNRIVKADVDIVGEAAAGGKINRLAASKNSNSPNNSHHQKGSTTMRQKLLSLLFFFPALLAGKSSEDWMKVQENELYSHLLQAGKGFLPSALPDGMTETSVDTLCASYRDNAAKIASAKFENGVLALQAAKADPPAPAPVVKTDNIEDLKAAVEAAKKQTEEIQKMQCANILASSTNSLPVTLRDSIRKKYNGKIFTVAELQASIDEGRELIAPYMNPMINNKGMDLKAGMDQYDKVQAAVDGLFLTSGSRLSQLKAGTDDYKKELKGVDPFRSIKEAYIVITGDENVTGQIPRNLRASLESADWTDIISTAMNKALVRDYAMLNLDTWRSFTDVVSLNDFKENQRVRFGGYANLPDVAEGGSYNPLTSPDDEKASYSAGKKGGTEDLTREMIKNDDVQALVKIPTRMARAAAQTLHQFVFDFIRPGNNPTIYDAIALYHATHANTGTTALGATPLANARLRMKKQTMLTNGKRIGIRGGFLIVPSDLEETAYGLLTPALDKYNQVPAFLQQVGIVPIVVDYWTDATDWVLAAKREDVSGLEVGFVDGQETPSVFISDLPNAGSMFTNDKSTFKIRHEYGGAIIDYRAFDGSIVA